MWFIQYGTRNISTSGNINNPSLTSSPNSTVSLVSKALKLKRKTSISITCQPKKSLKVLKKISKSWLKNYFSQKNWSILTSKKSKEPNNKTKLSGKSSKALSAKCQELSIWVLKEFTRKMDQVLTLFLNWKRK